MELAQWSVPPPAIQSWAGEGPVLAQCLEKQHHREPTTQGRLQWPHSCAINFGDFTFTERAHQELAKSIRNRVHGDIRTSQKTHCATSLEIHTRTSEMDRKFALPTVAGTNIERTTLMITAPW